MFIKNLNAKQQSILLYLLEKIENQLTNESLDYNDFSLASKSKFIVENSLKNWFEKLESIGLEKNILFLICSEIQENPEPEYFELIDLELNEFKENSISKEQLKSNIENIFKDKIAFKNNTKDSHLDVGTLTSALLGTAAALALTDPLGKPNKKTFKLIENYKKTLYSKCEEGISPAKSVLPLTINAAFKTPEEKTYLLFELFCFLIATNIPTPKFVEELAEQIGFNEDEYSDRLEEMRDRLANVMKYFNESYSEDEDD